MLETDQMINYKHNNLIIIFIIKENFVNLLFLLLQINYFLLLNYWLIIFVKFNIKGTNDWVNIKLL